MRDDEAAEAQAKFVEFSTLMEKKASDGISEGNFIKIQIERGDALVRFLRFFSAEKSSFLSVEIHSSSPSLYRLRNVSGISLINIFLCWGEI